jgi:hypothetical protein
MAKPKNAMEIFQVLDKSNCMECMEKTCLAFAGAVYMGRRRIEECPHLDAKTIARFTEAPEAECSIEQNRDDYLKTLRAQVAETDIAARADRLGGRFDGGRLTLKVLGKDFSVDTAGELSADIHVNPWVAIPFLDYVLNARGNPPSGRWISFRELKDGPERYPLFQKRCEAAMKQVADEYTELFDDMVHVFGGRQVAEQFESDISVVLHPLPKFPIMICYWQPEDGLASSLNIYFDEAAAGNLSIGSIFSLGAGLAQMFERLARRHGFS